MRKILLFALSLIIGLAIFGLATFKVGFKEIAGALAAFPIWGIIITLVLTLLIAFVGTWRLKFVFKTEDYDLPFFKLLEIWLLGAAVSYITPIAVFGGEIVMIYALRKASSLPWEKSSAAVFIHKVLDATIFFPFLILGVFTFPILSGFLPKTNIMIGGGIVASIFIVLLSVFYIKSFRKESSLDWFLKLFGMDKKKLEKKRGGRLVIAAEQDIINFFGLRKKEMWQGIGMSVLKYLLILARCWVLIFFFTGSWNILQAMAAYGFFNLAALIPVPAMLGSLEIAEGLVFGGMGLGASVGMAFSLILRSIDVLFCLVGLMFLLKFGAKLIRIKIIEIIDRFYPNNGFTKS